MGSKKNVDMSTTQTEVKIVTADEPEKAELTDKKTPVSKRVRSKKYVQARSQVDKTRKYELSEAVATVKRLSYSKFDGTISLDGVVKETGAVGMLTLPHSTGKSVKVTIVDEAVLKQIEEGNIDFDYLISTPQFMPKLAKHARVLGPKGLMPNPKNGTVTPKPELKKAELEKGTFNLKTEKKRPVIHVTIGKVSMDDKHLVENIEAVLNLTKGKIRAASISASMSPSVKLDISSAKVA